jgi:hypothetical protein
MKEEWIDLKEFPDYVISTSGEIVNMKWGGHPINYSRNQQGLPKVTLVRDNRPFTRSPARLVAETFIPEEREVFDTPINLDGDRMNCGVENLMWRPRWFAIKYHKQFMFENFHSDFAHRVDIESGEHYYSLKEVCMRNGLYYFDVIKSCVEKTFVPITYQEFRNVQE